MPSDFEKTHARLVARATRAVRRAAPKAAKDPQRPIYHVLPPANWNNDPNGPLFFNGEYHLFYQHNPFEPWWGNMSWGHVASPDLVHWRHLPIALVPNPGSYDKDGIFSGCCVDDDGTPTIIYTGVRPEVQCLATSDDGMLTWRKHPANPVIPRRPEGYELHGFRDPFAWRERGRWHVVIGSGIKEGQRNKGGTALLYRSRDLLSWDFVGPLCQGDPRTSGHNWECPNFFPIGRDKWCLVVSPHGPVLYWTGTYRKGRFEPESGPHRMDLGDTFYAPNCLADPQGRRIMWGWVPEARPKEQCAEAGWSCCMTVPRVLTLRDDLTLGVEPAPELAALRKDGWHLEDVPIASADGAALRGVRGDCLEIQASVDPAKAARVGLKVRRAPGGVRETEIAFDRRSRRLEVVRQRATGTRGVRRETAGGKLALRRGEKLHLRIFLDRSVIEVFANGRAALTTRVYPSRRDALGVALFAEGGKARVECLDIWPMETIWQERTRR